MIKTGILSTAYFEYDDYRAGMQKMREHGYDCIDYQGFARFAESPLYEKTDAKFKNYLQELKACAQDNGLEFWQLHGVWPHVDDTTSEGRKATREYLVKNMLGAEYLGCKRVVLHPCMPHGWSNGTKEEFFQYNVELLTELLPYAQEKGVILCLENMPFKQGESFSTIEEWIAVLDAINDKHVKACLDTGHSTCLNTGAYETVKRLGNRLEALHVHDDRHCQDRHLLPFQGEYDWFGFVQGLKEINFSGCISLECNVFKHTPQPIKEQMQIALSGLAKWLATAAEK